LTGRKSLREEKKKGGKNPGSAGEIFASFSTEGEKERGKEKERKHPHFYHWKGMRWRGGEEGRSTCLFFI